jgi:hypothetical protein
VRLPVREAAFMPTWPGWWEWELELSSHPFRRMADRNFGEVDIRRMLAVAFGLRKDIVPGRWIIRTRNGRAPWEVIVEPDVDAHFLIVITAYPLE